jgi:LPS O-antigen subunit length determinant protein (WzzB/FepE family)
LYGQRAIEQELPILKNQPLSDLQIDGATELIFKIEALSKIDLSKFNFEPVIISQPSMPATEPNEPKGKIIAIGTGLGLFIGLLVIFLSALMVQLREISKLSTHT